MTGRIVAIIPARGGSKRIRRKNLALLGARPLITYTIGEALRSKYIDQVIVSTDDPDIAKVASSAGAEVIVRPHAIATDTADVVDALRHSLSELEGKGRAAETVVMLQPTSPLRTVKQIDEAIEAFLATGADTLTSVRRVKEHSFWQWRLEGSQIVPVYSCSHVRMGRKDLPPQYIETGAIYIVKRSVLAESGLYGKTVIPYETDGLSSLDIDDPADLLWAEYLLRSGQENRKQPELAPARG